jgi:hypothetical protein
LDLRSLPKLRGGSAYAIMLRTRLALPPRLQHCRLDTPTKGSLEASSQTFRLENMLQINSGKLYPNGVRRTNELRGVLYSNLFLMRMKDGPIVTKAGRLLQAEATNLPRPVIFEVTEQFDDEPAVGVLISHGVQPYLQDFAAVVSFVLRATCTPDPDLCSRLLSEKRSLGVRTPPVKLVRRAERVNDCETAGFIN